MPPQIFIYYQMQLVKVQLLSQSNPTNQTQLIIVYINFNIPIPEANLAFYISSQQQLVSWPCCWIADIKIIRSILQEQINKQNKIDSNTEMERPNNSSYKYNYHINIQTPIKSKPNEEQNYMGSTFVKTPTSKIRSASSVQIREQPAQKQSELQLVEIPLAYGWNVINYRQSKYTGKILYTKYAHVDPLTHKQPDLQTLPHLNRTAMTQAAQGIQQLTQYKHGPGILVLDCNIWLIARWSYDQIDGDRAYVIGVDLGLLELHIKQKPSEKLKPKKNTNYDIEVEQVCCIGTTQKNAVKNSKYIILGSETQGTWKWVANLSLTRDHDGTDCYYYLQSRQTWSAKNRRNQLVSQILGWKQMPSMQGQNELQGIYRLGCYNNAIANITNILINVQKSHENEYQEGFKLQEKVTNVTTNIQTPLFPTSPPQEISHIQTLIYSDFNVGQTTQIRLKSQRFPHLQGINQKQAWNLFDITQLAVYRKDLKSREQMPTGSLEYLYRVKQVEQQVSKDGLPLLPNIQVEQRTSDNIDHRYRYKCSYNIFNSFALPSELYSSSSAQYTQVQKQKSKLHLRSLNFISRSHTRLVQKINQIMINVQTAYYFLKQVQQKKNTNVYKSKPQTINSKIKMNMEGPKYRPISKQQNQIKFGRYQGPEANLKDLKKQLQRIHLRGKYSKLKNQTVKNMTNKSMNKTLAPAYNKIYHSLSHNSLPISASRKKIDKLSQSIQMENSRRTNPERRNSQKVYKYTKDSLNNTFSRVVREQSPLREQDRQIVDSQLLNLTQQYGNIHRQLVEESMKNKIPLQCKDEKPPEKHKQSQKIANPKDTEKTYYDRMVRNYAKLKKQIVAKQQSSSLMGKKSFPSGTYKKYL